MDKVEQAIQYLEMRSVTEFNFLLVRDHIYEPLSMFVCLTICFYHSWVSLSNFIMPGYEELLLSVARCGIGRHWEVSLSIEAFTNSMK